MSPRPTPLGGMSATGRPPVDAPRPTRMMPGPGTPEPAPAAPAATPAGSADDGKKTSELGVNKIVAGAGAAIVTAVLGSFLGAVGTILGAALGSIITTVATTFFQRSIEHTRAQVTDKTQKIRDRSVQRNPSRGQGAAAWQGAQETVRIDAAAVGAGGATSPPGTGRRFRMSRRSILISAAGAVLAFVLAMFLVTGIEWIKGSTITGGGSGTSIGNVVQGTPAQQQRTDDQGGTSTSTSESTTPTSESSSTADPSSTSQNDGGSSSTGSSSNPLQNGLDRILPTQESGQRQSGQDGSNGSGGANSSN